MRKMRKTCLALKLKLVKGRGHETLKTKEFSKDLKKSGKSGGRKAGGKISRFPRYSCKQHSALNFSNVDLYTNNQQNFNSNGFFVQTSYTCNNFSGAISVHN